MRISKQRQNGGERSLVNPTTTQHKQATTIERGSRAKAERKQRQRQRRKTKPNETKQS